MTTRIRFHINWEKALEAIVWLANGKPNIGFFHIAKVFFFADKEHLQKYGRPILGDTYIAMKWGPVPSGIRDILSHDSFLDPDILEAIPGAFSVSRGNVPRVKAEREPDMRYFSETDRECLQRALDKYGSMPFGRLSDLTHRERAYLEAPENGPIDYAHMIDENLPNREELLEEIRENAAYALM